MLILYVAAAILASFAVEMVVHHLRNNYEIEWIYPFRRPERDLAREILKALRKAELEPERQMNKLFKVASDERW